MLNSDFNTSSHDLRLFKTTTSCCLVTDSVKSGFAVLQNLVEAHLWVLDLLKFSSLLIVGDQELAAIEAEYL